MTTETTEPYYGDYMTPGRTGPHPDPLQDAVQEAADRIRSGKGTEQDAKLIDQAFGKAKWENIRGLKQQTRKRTKWLK